MQNAIILLAGSLFIALFIERLLELLKALHDVREAKESRYQHWNKLSQQIANQLYHRLNQSNNSKYENFHIKLVSQYLFSEHPDYQGTHLISANKVRTIFVKYLAKVLGITLGIGFCLLTELNIFVLVKAATPPTETVPELFNSQFLTNNLGVVLSGVMMGLGAAPMHKFIVALERARQKRKNTGLV